MQTTQGNVEVVTAKPAGNGTAFNFKLSDGNWYGHGFAEPAFKKGDYIQFAWEQKGQWKNVQANSIEIVGNKKAAVEAPTPASKTASAGTDWDAKDRRITFLACRKDSIELTKMALTEGALKLGTKNKLEVLVAHVDELANDLYAGVYDEPFKEEQEAEQFSEEELNGTYE